MILLILTLNPMWHFIFDENTSASQNRKCNGKTRHGGSGSVNFSKFLNSHKFLPDLSLMSIWFQCLQAQLILRILAEVSGKKKRN